MLREPRVPRKDPRDRGNLPQELEKVSYQLAMILRHKAHKDRLLDNEGFLAMSDVLHELQMQGINVSVGDIRTVVSESYSKDRPRFEADWCSGAGGGRVRANEGEYYRNRNQRDQRGQKALTNGTNGHHYGDRHNHGDRPGHRFEWKEDSPRAPLLDLASGDALFFVLEWTPAESRRKRKRRWSSGGGASASSAGPRDSNDRPRQVSREETATPPPSPSSRATPAASTAAPQSAAQAGSPPGSPGSRVDFHDISDSFDTDVFDGVWGKRMANQPITEPSAHIWESRLKWLGRDIEEDQRTSDAEFPSAGMIKVLGVTGRLEQNACETLINFEDGDTWVKMSEEALPGASAAQLAADADSSAEPLPAEPLAAEQSAPAVALPAPGSSDSRTEAIEASGQEPMAEHSGNNGDDSREQAEGPSSPAQLTEAMRSMTISSEPAWEEKRVLADWDPLKMGFDPLEYLPLKMGMLLNVRRGLEDGWAWGETFGDPPRSGWFPPTYAENKA